MSEARRLRTVDLGDIAPARSRHAGRRSAVSLTGERIAVGTAAGTVLALDRGTLATDWRAATDAEGAAVVAAAAVAGGVVVGERGPEGAIRCYDRETGALKWRYETARDVGEPQKDSRFFLPFVASLAGRGDRVYAAARRYERDAGERSFTSLVYAFEADGTLRWTYETDASPISIDVRDDRVAVAYNRCPGTHQAGLVMLDAATGDVRSTWDPGTDGQRRVGDVSLLPDGVAVASHGDYRGYRLGRDGTERWRVDLATPTTLDGETLYAYPNHVHATTEGLVFVTGNTYSTDGRETASLHPDEHTAAGYTPAGDRRWTGDVGGFASELAADGDRVAVPGAQHFRTREADVHGLRLFGIGDGHRRSVETEGVVTAAAIDGGTVAAVEEPVVYHDEGTERGTYRLLVGDLD